MPMKMFVPALLALAVLTTPAFATNPATGTPVKTGPAFTCTPSEFAFGKESGGMRLLGVLPAAGPGYGYDITEEEPGPDGSIHASLTILPPVAPGKDKRNIVPVSYLFRGEGDRVMISVTGSSVTSIECHLAH